MGGTFCFNAALFNILEGQTDKEKLKQALSPLQKWFSQKTILDLFQTQR